MIPKEHRSRKWVKENDPDFFKESLQVKESRKLALKVLSQMIFVPFAALVQTIIMASPLSTAEIIAGISSMIIWNLIPETFKAEMVTKIAKTKNYDPDDKLKTKIAIAHTINKIPNSAKELIDKTFCKWLNETGFDNSEFEKHLHEIEYLTYYINLIKDNDSLITRNEGVQTTEIEIHTSKIKLQELIQSKNMIIATVLYHQLYLFSSKLPAI